MDNTHTTQDHSVENMFKLIKTTDNILSCVNSITNFLDTRYLSVSIYKFDEMHYDMQDVMLVRELYKLFDKQTNNTLCEKINEIKHDTLGILEYFARHLTGFKSRILCIIGNLYYNMKTNESIRKSVKYFRKAMRKGNMNACKKIYDISFLYHCGDQTIGIIEDDIYSQELYEIAMYDLMEDDDI